MKYTFEALPYSANSLEPYIDQKTMEIHHGKHHKGYFDNFVKAVQGTEWENKDLTEIFGAIAKLTPAVRNNAGGYYNHNFFWQMMHKDGMRQPEGKLKEAIDKTFGDYAALKKQLVDAGLARFGSGFAWLIVNKTGNLEVISTPNQNNPLMADEPKTGQPLMAIDVWEHAYYLHYQNRRADYLEAFFQVVCWEKATKTFAGG